MKVQNLFHKLINRTDHI